MRQGPRSCAFRRLIVDERGALMPEYLFVTAVGIAIAIAISASLLTLADANERAQTLIHSRLP
jgi:Flp pilus assembly pilin Flp